MQNIEKSIKFSYNINEVNVMPSTLRVNFSGLLKEMTLPEYKSLWPIFEAVVNSIQSISEIDDYSKGRIIVNAIRNQGTLDGFQNAPYNDFEIIDNGPGFNEQNYSSFLEAYSSLKVTKGCKGLGRFLWLKAFEKVVIESVYIENDNCYKRQFEFSEDSFITPEDNTVQIDNANPYTKVRLVGYRKKYQKNCSVSVEPIAKKIIEHCMMYFISDKCPQIVLSDDIDSININDYFKANIKDSLHQDIIEIQEQSFSIYHIQMRDNATRHELHLCASDREVESIDLSKKIHDLNTKLTDTNGNDYYYVGYITGEYLDTNVNSNRTAFYIDKEKSITNPITKEDLYNAAIEFIELYLGDDFKNVIEKKKDHIQHFVNLKKPQYKFLLNAKPNIIDDIPNGLKDDDLELELHKQSQKWERELKEIGKKIEQENKEKISSIGDYDDIFDKYCSGVTDLSRASLSEYVIRRKTILDLLEKALEWDDDKKYKKEEIIHSLICPMKHSSNDIPFDEMNLWLIDERLSFHNYLASDQELKSIPVIDSNSSDRIDIAIFDQALSFSIEKDHFNNITIIELKRPNRNNYSANGKDNDPIEQVLRYVKLIREGKAKLANGRGFGNVENTPFYCYIIADLTSTLIDRADTLGYTKTPDGEGYFGYNPNRNAYVEIISYTKLLDDAKKSNQVLFDKLFNPKSSEIKHHY